MIQLSFRLFPWSWPYWWSDDVTYSWSVVFGPIMIDVWTNYPRGILRWTDNAWNDDVPYPEKDSLDPYSTVADQVP